METHKFIKYVFTIQNLHLKILSIQYVLYMDLNNILLGLNLLLISMLKISFKFFLIDLRGFGYSGGVRGCA